MAFMANWYDDMIYRKISGLANNLDAPLVGWVGDDFTGAAAVMEVLSFAGLPSLLFLAPPKEDELADCEGLAAIGIATLARSKSPDWMAEHLPPLYRFMDEVGAGLVHYKICSTLDSAPHVGSIGKAIELGREIFGAAGVPVVTAAPELRRYQAFGSLFCSAMDRVYRLDRHPVMAHHPVTPMAEADVARHLAHQTEIETGCVDLEDLAAGRGAERLGSAGNIWSVDMMNEDHQAAVGELLWEGRKERRFVVGSQGIEYALVSYLQASGQLDSDKTPDGLGANPRIAVVSGSVSPISAAQIGWARANGFTTIRLGAADICRGGDRAEAAEAEAFDAARAALDAGAPPLIFTAEGPDDPATAEVDAVAGDDPAGAQELIGKALGRLLRRLIVEMDLTRVAVSGGDTSGHACEALGIYALEAVAPTIPGAAINRARAKGRMNGLEIALKGGQMGSPDFFGWVREGGGVRP